MRSLSFSRADLPGFWAPRAGVLGWVSECSHDSFWISFPYLFLPFKGRNSAEWLWLAGGNVHALSEGLARGGTQRSVGYCNLPLWATSRDWPHQRCWALRQPVLSVWGSSDPGTPVFTGLGEAGTDYRKLGWRSMWEYTLCFPLFQPQTCPGAEKTTQPFMLGTYPKIHHYFGTLAPGEARRRPNHG